MLGQSLAPSAASRNQLAAARVKGALQPRYEVERRGGENVRDRDRSSAGDDDRLVGMFGHGVKTW
jgi:hypothetical protein